jgi:hypothetical protein
MVSLAKSLLMIFAHPSSGPSSAVDFPRIDPEYVYNQLYYVATTFQHREAGYDTGLPANVNGHDEFATYWSQEIVADLQGFGPQVRHDAFSVQGWKVRPAIVPAFNVEVSIPGVTHPEQVVLLGCHYDGMANSPQSANDDASGCAIELGIAKAMGEYWRKQHTYYTLACMERTSHPAKKRLTIAGAVDAFVGSGKDAGWYPLLSLYFSIIPSTTVVR